MCGISLILDHKPSDTPAGFNHKKYSKLVKTMTEQLRHRGPDSFGYKNVQTHDDTFRAYLGHARLSIVDPIGGYQPLTDTVNGDVDLIINGEIYNHKSLKTTMASEYEYLTQSDCEVIIPLYLKHEIFSDFTEENIIKMIDKLDGIFAFCLVDSNTGNYIVARDAIGINPLYYMRDGNYKIYFSSELKSLSKIQTKNRANDLWFSEINEFLPGSFMSSCDPFKVKRWYQPKWLLEPTHHYVSTLDLIDHRSLVEKDLMRLLEAAVVKMMMSDVPFGVLLSGGLDSSVVASLVVKHSKMRVETDSASEAWYPRIHTFSVGMKDSPDLICAREVADCLGTVHHEIIFTAEDILESLSDVIYYTETYDITTIRASSAMMYLSKKIKTMGFKMVLSGEGSDEIFAGYLYNHWAPNADELHTESVRKVKNLHLYDCLRANKSMCAYSIECRPPFLDKEFVNYVMEEVDPRLKMIYKDSPDRAQRIEKGLLRQAFENMYKDHLPDSVLWRIKEQFSDGVGKGHIDALKQVADEEVTDEMMSQAHVTFPINTPYTKEHYLYRSIFESHFPSKAGHPELCPPHEKSIACSSQTALKWKNEWSKNWDPSGKKVF